MSTSDTNKLRRIMRKCSIVIVRSACATSKPCNRCLNMLKKCGFQKVYYSCGNDKISMEKLNIMESDHLSSKYRRPWADWNN